MFEIKVNVQVDVTPNVVNLVSAILGKVGTAAEPAPVEAPAPAADEAPAAPAKKPRKPKTETPEPEEPAPGTIMQTHNPEPEPAPAAPGEDLPYTEEEIRAAMHETRCRIEGEDYKENTTSERYVKYHKRLTAVFKSLAKDLSGQEKPSALPVEVRGAFIEACKLIQEAADGNVETPKVK